VGLLTDLIEDRRNKKNQEQANKVTAYKSVLNDPTATGQAKEWALQQMLGEGNVPKQSHGLVTNIFSHLLGFHRNPSGAGSQDASKPGGTSGAEGTPGPAPSFNPQYNPESGNQEQPLTPQYPHPGGPNSAFQSAYEANKDIIDAENRQMSTSGGGQPTTQPNAGPSQAGRPRSFFLSDEQLRQRSIDDQTALAQAQDTFESSLAHQAVLDASDDRALRNKVKAQQAMDAQTRADDIIRSNRARMRIQAGEDPSQVYAEERITGYKPETVKPGVVKKGNKYFYVNQNTGQLLKDTDTGELLEAPTPSSEKATKPVPGRDIPFSPAVEEQKKRIADAVARVRAAVSGGSNKDDIDQVAQGIMDGSLPPDLRGFYRNRIQVEAALRRGGFDLTTATRDWQAIQRYMTTLNGQQQLRLRQAVSLVEESLPQIEDLYAEWKKQAGISGYKILNRAALASMKQLPGEAGSAATQLDAQIADLTSELGTVYKGGNSSTDESLKLAATNLSGDWNEQTFSDAINRLKRTIGIRRSSIMNAGVAGVSGDSPYLPSEGTSATPTPDTGKKSALDGLFEKVGR
jgi:hypothetical protein